MKVGGLVVTDIDGCLWPGFGAPADLTPLHRLRAASAAAGGRLLTVATGRAPMYALAVAQLLDLRLPLVAEHGALFLEPDTLSLAWSDEELRTRWPDLEAACRRRLAPLAQRFRVEPGKSATLSLHPVDRDVAGLHAAVAAALADLPVTVNRSSLAVDVVAAGVDKGFGLRCLAQRLGVDLDAVLAIGDSLGDVPMLDTAGFAACPANADDDARAAVRRKGPRGYESAEPLAQGVEDALSWFGTLA
jgi:HAD superfamily hydrolase (TIGR01484 family)